MGNRPVLPPRTLRFQVGMNSLSVPIGIYQAGTQTPFFPWRSRDQTSFLFLPAAPVAAAICHRAEPLPSVHSNSFAAGRIWHGHKGPLSVPEVEHTMQSFPLVTQSWVSVAGLETLSQWLQPTNTNTDPLPSMGSSFPYKCCRPVQMGAFNSGDLYPDLPQGWGCKCQSSAQLLPPRYYKTTWT